MQPYFPDKRKAITGEFFINDSRIKHSSRKAFKKISGWKASLQATDSELHFREQFETLLRNSFFNLVTNEYILGKEKFFERPLDN